MYVLRNSRFTLFILSLALACGFSSCKDVIAKDLSKEKPVVILPQSGSTIQANPVHFKWQEVEGATKYKIQVVSPSFSNIQYFSVDSVVTGTNFYIPLDSNNYELKIIAMNAGYESLPSSVVAFTVGTSSGSGSGSVSLITPENEKYISNTSVLFKWAATSNVQNYLLELHSGPSFSDPFTISPEQTGAVQLNVTNLAEGTYSWGVKAYFTDGSESQFSKRLFYVDTTAPGNVTLLSPSNNSTFQTAIINLSWSGTNPGIVQSQITYTVEISRNNQFTDLAVSPSPEITETTYSFQGVTEDVYYWRIRTRDAAGNTGPVSPTYTFTKTF